MSIDHKYHYIQAGGHLRFPTLHGRPENHTIQITRAMDPLPNWYATLWNKLPMAIREITDRKQFSKTLKTALLEEQANDQNLFTTTDTQNTHI